MPRKCIWLDEQSPALPNEVMTSDPQTQNDGNFTNKEVSHLSGKHIYCNANITECFQKFIYIPQRVSLFTFPCNYISTACKTKVIR